MKKKCEVFVNLIPGFEMQATSRKDRYVGLTLSGEKGDSSQKKSVGAVREPPGQEARRQESEVTFAIIYRNILTPEFQKVIIKISGCLCS